jgi:isocitrate dehydrogenase (NAD+)
MAARLRSGLDQTLNVDKARTGDLGGHSSTAEFTRALIKRIANA